jgi:hypothetical protein
MATVRDSTRRAPTVDAAPDGVIILTALAAVPEVLRELGVEPGAVLAAAAGQPAAVPGVASLKMVADFTEGSTAGVRGHRPGVAVVRKTDIRRGRDE